MRDETNKEKTVTLSTRVTETTLKNIQEILRPGSYINIADYLRTIIRENLEKRKKNHRVRFPKKEFQETQE